MDINAMTTVIIVIAILAALASGIAAAAAWAVRRQEKKRYYEAAKKIIQEEYLNSAIRNPENHGLPEGRRRETRRVRVRSGRPGENRTKQKRK